MDDEKVRVLNMVKEGKISVEEATKILEALSTAEEEPELPQSKSKWFRVRITDLKTNRPKVSVNLPIGLVDWALRTGTKVASVGGVDLNGMGVNLEELRSAINYGLKGKIIDVVDEEDQTHVEIIVE
ncbi:MAG: SHOCT-like domain-containing protein [Bacillota bacterium]